MVTIKNSLPSERDTGSFRDPSGYVFRRQGHIYRSIDESRRRILQELSKKGILSQLTEQRLLVGSRFVEDPELLCTLETEHVGYKHFLEHDLITPITYPYEWSISMLADAAVHTLDLQMRLLETGFSLKDASAFNIQFVNGRPTFIDVSSIDRPARLDLWIALGQFSQMFTFPLLLHYYYNWDFRSYFLGNINGRDVEQVARTFGWLGRLRPRVLLDLTLPLILNRKANKVPVDGQKLLEKSNKNAKPQLMYLKHLRAKIHKLGASYTPRGIWVEYTTMHSYSDEAEKGKKALVRQFIESVRPTRVLDIGCNVGEYSHLAAEWGAHVIAADADHDAVEILYRRLRGGGANITPIVLDLGNPSPAIGYRNRERLTFLDRLDVDCVMALALVHHLIVSGNLSLSAIRDLFFDMTKDYLVLEFVPTNDVMFQHLAKFRVHLHSDLTQESFRRVFAERFVVVREEPIPCSLRTLMLLRKM